MTTASCLAPHRFQPDRPRRAVPGLMLCSGCRERLERDLHDAPVLLAELEQVLSPTGSSGGRVSGSADVGLRLDYRVIEARSQIVTSMSGWTRIVIEERDLRRPHVDTPGVLAALLVTNAEWIAAQPWVDDLWRELIADPDRIAGRPGWIERGRSLLARSRRRPVELGLPCPTCDEGSLISLVRDTDALLPSSVWCDCCDAEWTSDRWMALGRLVVRHRPQPAAYERLRRAVLDERIPQC